MEVKIVKSSELGDKCWSAHRFTGTCHLCSYVNTCKLKEASEGRIKILKTNLLSKKAEIKAIKEQIRLEKTNAN